MKQFRGRFLAGLIGACVLAGAPEQVPAQSTDSYPNRPIRLLISSPAAGGVDVVGRLVADRLTRTLGWSIVVDNRAGAGGNIGTEIVAKSNPDGYTLLLTANNHNMNSFIYKNPGYDPRKDFVAIVQFTEAPSVLITHPSKSPFRTLKDVIDAARAQPGKIVYGTAGSGTATHAAGEMFKKAANIDMTHVPYKGGPQANQDVMAGQISLGVAALPAVMATIKAGRLRALAVTSEKRWPGLPDVPAAAESYPKFKHLTWIGSFAPARTPSPIVARLNREIAAALKNSELSERIAGLGAQPVGRSPAEFEAMLKAEYEATGKLVSEIGLKVH